MRLISALVILAVLLAGSSAVNQVVRRFDQGPASNQVLVGSFRFSFTHAETKALLSAKDSFFHQKAVQDYRKHNRVAFANGGAELTVEVQLAVIDSPRDY